MNNSDVAVAKAVDVNVEVAVSVAARLYHASDFKFCLVLCAFLYKLFNAHRCAFIIIVVLHFFEMKCDWHFITRK